ncbi:Aldehyde dehydrogenase N-terminal [Penicillium concentricum]|uniref:aldehyde dehydrogenase (NAD(+)) n=1 Tax=Penicillium concentricum TaxID=293559 RepID=A0A9W9RHQ7_9EURO|nr:Aldehyde dehydrogenase N-terminal [Penicillium concentricum]KAJ5360321.1 Aldehyde dehydrogenase N-terminal [Penicillium concentricum]
MFYNIINSERRARDSVTVTNPRTNEALWEVTIANETDLNDAVEAARASFESWKLLSVETRQTYLLKLADELEQRRGEIHAPLAAETGKSSLLANIEIDDTLAFIRFNASQSLPDKVEYENDKLKIVSTHHPIGVVGAICPWNFPLVLAAGKIAAALVMGNCIIVKPSPFTPCATLKFAELATSVLPQGVLQALNGDNGVGRLITLHPGIDKISFTGSITTGKKVAENAAKTLKRVTLELGGNDASIICPDVDVKTVAPKVAAGSFFHSGQMCVATKRIYVHQAVFEKFRDAFMEAVKNIKIDISGDESPLFSPIQNELQYKVVKDLIWDCKENNYTLLCGGNTDEQPGLFIAPVVVDRPPHDSRIIRMEQFGPIIPLTKWSTEDEVISKVNGTDTGLAACVWSDDIGAAERIARKLEVGTVWINSAESPNPNGYMSGWKQSGIGGEWGNQGLLSYCHTQIIQLYK